MQEQAVTGTPDVVTGPALRPVGGGERGLAEKGRELENECEILQKAAKYFADETCWCTSSVLPTSSAVTASNGAAASLASAARASAAGAGQSRGRPGRRPTPARLPGYGR